MSRQLFPAFLDLVGRRVLIVGGGPVAASKAPRLLEAGAHVVVVSPQVAAEFESLPVEIHRRAFVAADLDGAWYVVSAAPPAVNAEVLRAAAVRGIFVNAVDDPRHATAFAGSGFRRGPVTVAMSTAGEAPALARVLREALERLVGPEVENWTALANQLRVDWRREGVPMEHRRDALLEAMATLHAEAVARPPRSKPRATGRATATRKGFVSLIGAGPGDPELLTRKAARRLAEADLVLYDALVSPATVAVASRAQRIFVGRRRGAETMGQEAIIRTLIRAARRGRRVVRLKGGDPFVFGRGGEEALALKAADVKFEVVPGVSSAFAAAASASIPVTHRGVSSAVLVTTGHDTERFASLASSVAPEAATLVVLMGTAARHEIASALVDAGWKSTTPAAIVWNGSLPDQSTWSGTLAELPRADAMGSSPGTIIIGKVVALGHLLTRQVPVTRQEVCHG